MQHFRLSPSFVSQYVGKQPTWGPLGYIVYKRTYARPVEGEDRTEEWWETLKRVVEGCYEIQRKHCEHLRLEWKPVKAQKSAQKMFRLMWDFKLLPPGRGLQIMGTPLVDKLGNAALQNCAFVSTEGLASDFAAPFCFLMDMSMLGVGVGADTKGAGALVVQVPRIDDKWIHVVPDTREGWVELVRMWLKGFIGERIPAFIDYSQIRPYGAPIKGMGGTASGPEPLMQLIDHINTILKPIVGQRITSSAIVDLFNAIGRCVVSGNVRRSAEIMFGDITDRDFLTLKDPQTNGELLDKWRWVSNNSVVTPVGGPYEEALEFTTKNGEPGYFWLENARAYGRMKDGANWVDSRAGGTNPCGEITLESFEFCTLVETFPAHHDTLAEWVQTLKYAYLYAKTVTLIPSHDPRSNAVMLRNRRIGVSQSGIAQALHKFGISKYTEACDAGYLRLKQLDTTYSEWLCVPKSIKLTTVKPSGTISHLCGATPGIHFPYSEYYWRTIRFDSGSPLLELLREAGYRIVQGEGLSTQIVYIPVKEVGFSRSVKDLSIWEQMEFAALLQRWWADNQVSVTVSFKQHEAKELKSILELYDRRLKAVSFLPYAEHQYEHAPYQPIDKSTYDEAVTNLRPLADVLGMESGSGTKPLYCDGDRCEVM